MRTQGPKQPFQQYCNNTERVALQRRLESDDQWVRSYIMGVQRAYRHSIHRSTFLLALSGEPSQPVSGRVRDRHVPRSALRLASPHIIALIAFARARSRTSPHGPSKALRPTFWRGYREIVCGTLSTAVSAAPRACSALVQHARAYIVHYGSARQFLLPCARQAKLPRRANTLRSQRNTITSKRKRIA